MPNNEIHSNMRKIILLVLLLPLLHATGGHALSLRESQRLIDKGRLYLVGKEVNIDSAIYCFRKVADSYRPDLPAAQRELCGKAANNLGYIYLQHGVDCPKAYKTLMKAKTICEEVGNSRTLATVYMNIANLYSIFCEHINSPEFLDEAVRMYRRSFYLACKNRRWDIVCNSFCNLTDLDQDFSHTTKYGDVVRSFGRLRIPKGVPLRDYSRLRYLSVKAYIDKQPALATGYLIQSVGHIDDQVSPGAWKAQALNLIASVYMKRNMPDSALHYIGRIFDAPYGYWGTDVKANAYEMLRRIYEAKGEKAKAHEAYSRMLIMRDSLFNVDNLSAVENMKFLNDLAAQKHHASKMLAEANRKKELRGWVLLPTGLLLVLAVVLVVLLVRRNHRLEERYKELYRKQQDILAKEREERLRREAEMKAPAAAEKSPAVSAYTAPRHAVSQQTRILAVMDETQEKFSPDFSLDRLAELVGISPRALSAVLNESLGKTFRDLLNEYRVREACSRLSDIEHYGGYTIESISQSVGYRSRTSLVSAFKKETGLTPSDYQRIARNGGAAKGA